MSFAGKVATGESCTAAKNSGHWNQGRREMRQRSSALAGDARRSMTMVEIARQLSCVRMRGVEIIRAPSTIISFVPTSGPGVHFRGS